MTVTPPLRRIALTTGDPNGIGPEIALKALAALGPTQRNHITVFGPGAVLQRAAAVCDLVGLWSQIQHTEVGTLPDNAAVRNLLQMTPHYWRAARDRRTVVESLPSLTLQADFRILVFRKIRAEQPD